MISVSPDAAKTARVISSNKDDEVYLSLMLTIILPRPYEVADGVVSLMGMTIVFCEKRTCNDDG
jgi:hypothetical protein